MAPRGFMQLYVIHVPLGNTAVSTVYAVLQRKSLPSYVELFQAVIDHFHSMELYIDPITVVCDFEQGVIKALQTALGPAITIQGCFYHLTQATWHKIQELGLAPRYSTDEEFKLFCCQLDALAFLPIEDIPVGMASLRENTPDGPMLQEAIAVLNQVMVRLAFGSRGFIHYPPAVWNVHEATLAGEPRTNNQCEGWNNRFTHLIGYSHPTIWILTEAIQKDCFIRTQISEDLIGNPPAKRVRRKQNNLQARLLTLCQDRQSGRKTVTELLRGVGYNIRWKDTL
ncbi:uncharacterized protein LOC121385930 [Gigantopelta aegis]|uniref:uncharacterized protein LOC121385930 n=1 Tax=Gigantopelta aegis TaxID=1735272 RepID=UPI001B887F9B|nr:uncharacterized protein LOC121385930 [Gigantopelta aegis]